MPYDSVPARVSSAINRTGFQPGAVAPAVRWSLFLAAYLATAIGAAMLAAGPNGLPVVWPAAGVAAGAAILAGRAGLAAIAVAVVATSAATAMLLREPLLEGLILGACHAIEAVIVAALLSRLDRSGPRLETLDSVMVFLVAAFAAAALTAIPAAFALEALRPAAAALDTLWLAWMASHAIGIVVVAPVVVTARSLLRNPPTLLGWLEGIAALAGLGLALAYSFELFPLGLDRPTIAPPAVAFPLILWIAARAPPAFAAFAALLVAIVIGAAAALETGRFDDGMALHAQRYASAYFSIMAGSLCSLTFAAAFARTRNITAALRESEQRVNLALSAAGIYAFDYDLVHGTVHRSGGFASLLDLPASGRVDDFVERLHPADQVEFLHMLHSLNSSDNSISCTLRLKGGDGQYHKVQHRAEGIVNAQRRLVRIIGSCIDITAPLKIAEARQALHAAEDRLSKVMEAGRIYTFDSDAAGDVVTRSANAAAILGLPENGQNVALKDLLRRVPREHRTRFSEARAKLTPASPDHAARFAYDRPGGQRIWLEVIERANFDTAGELTGFSGLVRDVTARTVAEDKQDSLIRELNHRVKNTLARVNAVVIRSRRDRQTVDEFAHVLAGRIATMARTHERLSLNDWDGVDLETLVRDELEPYLEPRNIEIAGPFVSLSPDMAQGVSLTLHELATNAAKYGGLSSQDGAVRVSWSLEEGKTRRLHLVWKELAGKPISPPSRESYGTATIKKQLAHEFKARVDLAFETDGVRCTIMLPLDGPPAAGQSRDHDGRGGATGAPAGAVPTVVPAVVTAVVTGATEPQCSAGVPNEAGKALPS